MHANVRSRFLDRVDMVNSNELTNKKTNQIPSFFNPYNGSAPQGPQ